MTSGFWWPCRLAVVLCVAGYCFFGDAQLAAALLRAALLDAAVLAGLILAVALLAVPLLPAAREPLLFWLFPAGCCFVGCCLACRLFVGLCLAGW